MRQANFSDFTKESTYYEVPAQVFSPVPARWPLDSAGRLQRNEGQRRFWRFGLWIRIRLRFWLRIWFWLRFRRNDIQHRGHGNRPLRNWIGSGGQRWRRPGTRGERGLHL